MKHLRLKTTNDNYFHEVWTLYESAFPLEERRLLDAQVRLMAKPNYHFDVITANKTLVGFLLWWELEALNYIDHLATLAEHRNKGFGALILENYIERSPKPIVLEVELPSSSINKRRIMFYERIGFNLNEHDYEMPPMRENEPLLPLRLMSYPAKITKEDVEQFVKVCHPVIFQ